MKSKAEQIRDVRKRLGLKQGEFASRLGVSQTSVSRWEAGIQEPDWKIMLDIGRLAGVDPVYFSLLTYEKDYGAEIDSTAVDLVGTISDVADRQSPRWNHNERIRMKIPLQVSDGHVIEAYKIDDDSYSPRYPKNTLVFSAIYRMDKNFFPRNDDICVCFDRHSKGLWKNSLMRFRWERGGRITLTSLKSREFEELDLDENSVLGNTYWLPPSEENIFIAGMVVGSFIHESPRPLPELEPEEEDNEVSD